MRAAGQVEAGGLVPPDAELPPEVRTDSVGARGYRHPAFPDWLVVRLVPHAIARGVDSELELLGFTLAVRDDHIARQRHRTLGFPGWALVHDPDRAREALEVMEAFRIEAKRAASEPGHSRKGFEQVADGLARRVPHFLPSFWEEVGRVFVDAGNPKLAAAMFDKARTAEREHGLPVDERVRAETFLEFALAGAVTVKSLQGWAKELTASEGPAEAYARFYALAVRRTLGGLPPWAAIGKELRGLARAAKRDVDEEDERFVTEVLAAPSLDRAPASFWTDYRDAVVRAAQRDPQVRRQLLDRLPSGGGSRGADATDGVVDAWLDLLHEAGALRSLCEGEGLVDCAAWLAEAIAWAPRGYGPMLQLARAMAPRLVADDRPLPLGDAKGWARLDVDLADLLVELGVPLAKTDALVLDLGRWGEGKAVSARWGWAAERRPRDPIDLVAHPELGPKLVGAVGEQIGGAAFEAASRDSRALVAARRGWLAEQIERVDRQGVPSAAKAIERLSDKSTPGALAPWPELRARLGRADLARALAATLRVGLADELGWPEWDEAKRELGAEDLVVGGPLPCTVLASRRRAIVLGADGARLTAVDLAPGEGDEVVAAAWINGHLLLVVRDDDDATLGRWLPGRGEPFATTVPHWENVVRVGVSAPGGGVSCGGPAVRPGDARWPEAKHLYTDGVSAWVLSDGEVRRLDPSTGAPGPIERPAFLAEVAPMWIDACALYPAPPSSPLGVRDGLYGWRVHGEPLVFEAADGRSIDRTVGDDDRPHALATWPGDPAPRPLYRERWGEEGLHVCSPEGWHASTQPEEASVPLSRWHWLRPRDPAGSAALRTFPVERARALIDLCRELLEDGGDPAPAVDPLLPDIAHPGLRAAVGAMTLRAADVEGKLRDLVARVDACDGEPGGVTTEAARDALGVLGRGGSDRPLGDAIRTGLRFLRTGEGRSSVRWSDLDWPSWYGSIRALGWAAARVGATPAHRRTLRAILRTWAEAGGCAPMHLRRATWSFDRLDAPFLRTKVEDGERTLQEHWTVAGEGARALAWTDDSGSDEGPFTVEALEWSATGEFPEHAGATLIAERRWSRPAADPSWIERMIAAIDEHGERVPSEVERELVAARTGLGRGGAVLLLAGAPRLDERGRDFLGEELRAALGLEVAEAAAGRDALGSLSTDDWLAVLSAAMPDDPHELWGPEAPARLARAWIARFGAGPPTAASS